jgi:hypothetical protein
MPALTRCAVTAAVGLITLGWLIPVLAEAGEDAVTQQVEIAAQVAEAQSHEAWRDNMARIEAPRAGCFQADYPSIVWTEVQCQAAVPRVPPRPPRPPVNQSRASGQTVGNGVDYVIQSAGLIKSTVGTFPTVINVTAETGVGVPAFGNGGILGPNEYTLQINSNYLATTAACAGKLGCTVWQQFVYSPDYSTKGTAQVFMQYWLLNYGTACPGGWTSSGTDCYRNSSGLNAPDEPITELANMKLSASATGGGNDTATFTHGTTAYAVSAADSALSLSTIWNQSEFNVVGNAGGSQAQFNQGASITVNIAITDGTSNTPTCVANDGSTGETNNLTLGACTASAGSTPSVQFTEADIPPCTFTLAASPGSLTIPVGSSASSTVTVNGSCGVTFSGEGNIPNQVVYLSATGISTSTLVTVDILSGTPIGTYVFDVNGTYALGTSFASTETVPITINVIAPRKHALFDFDGDGKSDYPIFRQSSGQWFVYDSSNGANDSVFGVSGQLDIPTPGDYDGDGKTDRAYWNPSTGTWNVALSSTGTTVTQQWGSSSLGDIPVPGDYDGDGKTDYAVYRQSTGQWFIILSSTGQPWNPVFGVSGQKDVPIPGDFDGDGKTDLAYWDPTTGTWHVTLSSTNTVTTYVWGSSSAGDIPVSGDFDGDKKADYAVFRQSTGQWFIILSSTGASSNHVFGVAGQNDIPVQGDFDGDGKADLAYWDPTTGNWHVTLSSTGATTSMQWGSQSLIDIPASAPSSYISTHF